MKLLFPLLGHLLVTLTRLARPGGVRSVVAESLAVKYQLLIMKRSQRRSPNLTSRDRLLLGFYTLLVSPKRLREMAAITKTSTLLRLRHALVKCKYHLLYSSQRPGPKGRSRELIAAVVEMKRRNPRMGCRKIAEQISNAFGFEISKDVVRRILIQQYRPPPPISTDPACAGCSTLRSRDRAPVRARTATTEERKRVWPIMTAHWPDYDTYQAGTRREILVVLLTPR